MSMKTVWDEGNTKKAVTSPISLVVTAFAGVNDARKTLTPALQQVDSTLILIDLGAGKNRLGGSSLAQVYGQVGDVAPDVDDANLLKNFFDAIQRLNNDGKILAYHDRSDGGLFTTVCEMAFAGRAGLVVDLSGLQGDDLSVLYAEELGAVIQVTATEADAILSMLKAQLNGNAHMIGTVNDTNEVIFKRDDKIVYAQSRVILHRMWSETTYQMQKLRDNPVCAQQEYDRILDISDKGLCSKPSFDVQENIAAPYLNLTRPKMAILREQGVNGHVEMAAAFDRAGFAAFDVHMSDIIAGRVSLQDFAGLVACGGFSYGDVLGAGEGWAKSILFNDLARDEFSTFFNRKDSFALGVCNGCQMMSNLKRIIPGAELWPHFVKNKSEQFEARIAMVEVQESNSLFFKGMAGSRLPITVAHGEGYTEFFENSAVKVSDAKLVTLNFVDNHGNQTETYPFNPNGSVYGITGLTSTDGRFSIMMPHPERVFRQVQNTWQRNLMHDDNAPWLRMFQNARKFVG